MENWFFLDPPRWTVDIEDVDGLEVKSPSLHPSSIPSSPFLRFVTVRSRPAGHLTTTMASLTSPPSILMDWTCQVKVTVKLTSILLGDDHKVCH